MSRFIIHVGPGKCGSTSIQNAFASGNAPTLETTRLHFFAPDEFIDLEEQPVSDTRLSKLDALITQVFEGVDIAILSHEFLFQTPRAVGIIAERLRRVSDDVRVIGYVRSQSSLLISTYSQWLFRAKSRVDEAVSVIQDAGYSPFVFTGLERQFIAAIIDDFHSARQLSGYHLLNLWAGYRRLINAAAPTPITVGALPKSPSGTPLLTDFCKRSGLSLKRDAETTHKANPKFQPGLVEVLTEAVARQGAILDPHGGNARIQSLSDNFASVAVPDTKLQAALSGYVDAYFAADNVAMTAHFGLPEDYFIAAQAPDKAAILDVIAVEQARRLANPAVMKSYYLALNSALAKAEMLSVEA